jgi:hypothetical protein
LPLIPWTIIRLDVSENDWRRHESEMDHREEESFSPLRTRRRTMTLGLRKATLRSRVHVQAVGLNAEPKKVRHRAEGEVFLLTFPFIGLYR